VNWYGEIIYKKGFGADAATGRKIVMNWRQHGEKIDRKAYNQRAVC